MTVCKVRKHINRRGALGSKGLAIVVCAVALFALGIWGLARKLSNKHESERIGTATITDLVSRVTVAGVVNPDKMTNVAPPYNGYVKKLYVKLGEKVTAGAPLVSIAQSSGGEGGFPLRSPFTGTVVQILKSEGEYVDPARDQSAILKIYDLTRMFIEANVSEADINKIHEGLEAVIRPSGVNSRTYKGIIRELFLAAKDKSSSGGGGDNNNLAEFPVKVEVLDADSELKAGMSAIMDIIVGKEENVLALPHEFVNRDKEGRFVTLESGEKREVKVGAQNEDLIEIRSGLKAGDKVRQIDFKSMSGAG
jgi:multidrug efflux pump subunit AcrA (membrane-fusion protein)